MDSSCLTSSCTSSSNPSPPVIHSVPSSSSPHLSTTATTSTSSYAFSKIHVKSPPSFISNFSLNTSWAENFESSSMNNNNDPYSSQTVYLGDNTATLERSKKTSNVTILSAKNSKLFGNYPLRQDLVLVVCQICYMCLKIEALTRHLHIRHNVIGHSLIERQRQKMMSRAIQLEKQRSHQEIKTKSDISQKVCEIDDRSVIPTDVKVEKDEETDEKAACNTVNVLKDVPEEEKTVEILKPSIKEELNPFCQKQNEIIIKTIKTLEPVIVPMQQQQQQRVVTSNSTPPVLGYPFSNKPNITFNPDKHCGVIGQDQKICKRSLTCKFHGVSSKRGVLGRSMPFDQLIKQHKLANQQKVLTAKMVNNTVCDKNNINTSNNEMNGVIIHSNASSVAALSTSIVVPPPTVISCHPSLPMPKILNGCLGGKTPLAFNGLDQVVTSTTTPRNSSFHTPVTFRNARAQNTGNTSMTYINGMLVSSKNQLFSRRIMSVGLQSAAAAVASGGGVTPPTINSDLNGNLLVKKPLGIAIPIVKSVVGVTSNCYRIGGVGTTTTTGGRSILKPHLRRPPPPHFMSATAVEKRVTDINDPACRASKKGRYHEEDAVLNRRSSLPNGVLSQHHQSFENQVHLSSPMETTHLQAPPSQQTVVMNVIQPNHHHHHHPDQTLSDVGGRNTSSPYLQTDVQDFKGGLKFQFHSSTNQQQETDRATILTSGNETTASGGQYYIIQQSDK